MKILCILFLILLGAVTCSYSQVADSLEQAPRVDTTVTALATPAQSFTPNEPDDFLPVLCACCPKLYAFLYWCWHRSNGRIPVHCIRACCDGHAFRFALSELQDEVRSSRRQNLLGAR